MYFPGGLYVQAGENEKGLPNFERAHQMTPASWAALYMGKAKLKLGDAKSAVEDLQQAAELNPDEHSVFYLLSKGLRTLGRDEEAKTPHGVGTR